MAPVALAALACLAAATVELARHPLGGGSLAGATALLTASFAAEALPLPIEGVTAGATSLATMFIVSTAAIYGWAAACVIGLLAMALVEVGRRRPLVRVVYNSATYACAATAAGVAAEAVGGSSLGATVLRALAGAAAFYLVDIVLVGAVMAQVGGGALPRTLRRHFSSTALPFLIMASLTVTLVLLWRESPFVSLVLVGPLIAIALYERSRHGTLERLREFDRLKDEFIAVISHELRTPLTSVYGAALTLREKHLDEEAREQLLGIVSDEAGRLARLLDNALWAGRLDSKREHFDIQPTDAAATVRAAVEATRPRLPPGLSLEFVERGPVPLVAADPDKLRQVLVNLLENAIKYSPDGGRVEIELERVDGCLRFRVADEGIGIPHYEQARIFEKFHRLDPNMTQGVGGTGLGLYISRELVERMGGRISVHSREGAGSTFTFELPLDG